MCKYDFYEGFVQRVDVTKISRTTFQINGRYYTNIEICYKQFLIFEHI